MDWERPRMPDSSKREQPKVLSKEVTRENQNLEREPRQQVGLAGEPSEGQGQLKEAVQDQSDKGQNESGWGTGSQVDPREGIVHQ